MIVRGLGTPWGDTPWGDLGDLVANLDPCAGIAGCIRPCPDDSGRTWATGASGSMEEQCGLAHRPLPVESLPAPGPAVALGVAAALLVGAAVLGRRP